MFRLAQILGCPLLAAALLFAVWPQLPPVAIASTAPTFGEPTVSGIQGYGFEEDLRVDATNGPTRGTVYTSSPNSLSSGTSFIWRSLDGGKTFKWIPDAVQPTGKLTSCAGGGDSELAIDTSGNLYYNDLTVGNFTVGRSNDQGTTMTAGPCASVSDTAVDRQWYSTTGDPTNGGHLFLSYDRIAQSNPGVCTGGAAGNNIMVLAQSPAAPSGGASAGLAFAPSQVVSCDEGIMGNNENYTYGTGGGAVTRVFDIHDNAALDSISMVRCDVVPIGATASATPTGFANCVDTLISSFPGELTGANFPTLAIDKSGNLLAVWEQTDGNNDTLLRFSTSNNQGNTWSAAQTLPTSGLNTNVFAWPGAGDSGKFDVAWYGTSSKGASPDAVPLNSTWSLYMSQTLDGGSTWTPPILASQHFIHEGTIQTLIGGQTGDRTLGDFLQLRIGNTGEANISYADSNNIDEASTPQAMFVKQNGGTSVSNNAPTVNGDPVPINSVTNPSGNATFDSAGTRSANQPNLDLLGSSMTAPDSSHYQITIKVADLTSLGPDPNAGGPDLVWQTLWHVPSITDPTGGKIFFVYMESDGGGVPSCYAGESAEEPNGGGILLTYPGVTQLTGTACSYTATAPGYITITVPRSAVAEANPISPILFSVVSSSQSLAAPANSVPPTGGIGGVDFNLIDVTPTYNFDPSVTAARIVSFTVSHKWNRTVFHWRVVAHSGVIGFNLYAGHHRLNGRLVRPHPATTYVITLHRRLRGPFSLQLLLRRGDEVRVTR